jgi:hypothetical protein
MDVASKLLPPVGSLDQEGNDIEYMQDGKLLKIVYARS